MLVKSEAVTLSREVEQQVKELSVRGMRLARLLDDCRRKGVHEALGMNWEAWVTKYCGYSLSNVRRKLQISRGFEGVPTKELLLLKEDNAYAALSLPVGERTKQKWLELAANMPTEAFRDAVSHFHGKNGSGPEEFATFSLRAPTGIIASLKEAEAKVGRMLQVDVELPSGRIAAWEAIAALVNTSEPEHLLIEMKGGD